MATGIIPIIKQAAVEVMEARKMTDWFVGTVVSTSPLSISIRQDYTLSENFLVVGNSVMPLEVNDRVVLLRKYRGGSYLVFEKLG